MQARHFERLALQELLHTHFHAAIYPGTCRLLSDALQFPIMDEMLMQILQIAEDLATILP
jgi:hypothetical protein